MPWSRRSQSSPTQPAFMKNARRTRPAIVCAWSKAGSTQMPEPPRPLPKRCAWQSHTWSAAMPDQAASTAGWCESCRGRVARHSFMSPCSSVSAQPPSQKGAARVAARNSRRRTFSRASGALADVREHGTEGLLEELLVDPEEDLLADLLRIEHSRLAQELEMVRHGRARKRRDLDNLPHVQALPAL